MSDCKDCHFAVTVWRKELRRQIINELESALEHVVRGFAPVSGPVLPVVDLKLFGPFGLGPVRTIFELSGCLLSQQWCVDQLSVFDSV